MSEPKRYRIVINNYWETELRSTDECIEEGEHVESQEYVCLEDYARLKAEVERLTAFTTRTIIPNEELQAQVERLTKAGDAVCESPYLWETDPAVIDWRAAKEGKGKP